MLFERRKGSSNTSNVGLSAVSVSNLNKNVKRYSRKDLLACNNSHLGETRSAFVCNNAMNVSCDYGMNDLLDDNNFFIFDDVNIVQICLWIIDSRCSKHMMGNHALLTNFVEKFLETVCFGNNDFAVIAGYGDLVIGSMMIKKAYYIMKFSTTNVESSNVKVPSPEEEVFHEIFDSFQGESSSFSLNDDVQQCPEEDAYFDASTSFHDPSNVQTFYQPYPHEKKWTKDHPLYKIIGDPKSSVCTRRQLANSCLFSWLLSSIEPANVAEALRDADWVSAIIPGLECNQALPKNVPFVNNKIIEEPEYGIFFTDEFRDQAFQRWSDINKVRMEALVSYLVAASMVKSPKNARFSMKLRKLITEHPGHENLKSKKVKLEAIGYKID
nr:copia protein [Tanacetum cinerariifolium]